MEPARLNNHQIAVGLHRKENAAVNLIYQMYFTRVFSLIEKLTNHCPEAEDIAFNVFISLLESPKRFGSKKLIRDFIMQTAKNLSLDHNKRQRKNKVMAEAILMQSENSVESSLEEAETISLFHKMVAEAISQLPMQCRQVFKLYYEKSMTNPQIAEQLNLEIKTVANQKSIALKQLKMEIRKKTKLLFSIIFCI